MRIPRFAELSAQAQDSFEAIDREVGRLSRIGDGDAAGMLAGSIPPPRRSVRHIHHPLTPLFKRPPDPISLQASREERLTANRHAGRMAATLNSFDLADGLSTISSIVREVAGVAGPRRRGSRTTRDRFQRCVVFPAAPEARQQLARIVELIQDRGPRPSSFDALVTLVAITNCHAFADGNGRLSRILGNWLLFGRRDTQTLYLPIREFATFSRGGYIIRIRQAELRDDWHDLALYFLKVLKLWRRYKYAITATI